MDRIWAVARRELISFYTTPLAWLVLAAWTLITNLGFWLYTLQIYETGAGTPLYVVSMWIGALALIFLAPALTMNSFAAERVQGTEQLLLTVPITERHLVLGKFVAVLGMFASLLITTLSQPIILYFLSDNGGSQLFAAYLGFILLIVLLGSLGLWISMLVDSPVAAYVLTFGAIVVLYLVGVYAQLTPVPEGWFFHVSDNIGIGTRLGRMLSGDLRSGDVGYFIGGSTIFLLLSHSALMTRRIHG
jgi:ABC-2 type transport system permease protein